MYVPDHFYCVAVDGRLVDSRGERWGNHAGRPVAIFESRSNAQLFADDLKGKVVAMRPPGKFIGGSRPDFKLFTPTVVGVEADGGGAFNWGACDYMKAFDNRDDCLRHVQHARARYGDYLEYWGAI